MFVPCGIIKQCWVKNQIKLIILEPCRKVPILNSWRGKWRGSKTSCRWSQTATTARRWGWLQRPTSRGSEGSLSLGGQVLGKLGSSCLIARKFHLLVGYDQVFFYYFTNNYITFYSRQQKKTEHEFLACDKIYISNKKNCC